MFEQRLLFSYLDRKVATNVAMNISVLKLCMILFDACARASAQHVDDLASWQVRTCETPRSNVQNKNAPLALRIIMFLIISGTHRMHHRSLTCAFK
ncbi:unnamed protein product [Amoebophrya sp. A120]|nr:unnamed protein product [Amoebophrya sp. A120]|eukprot:GSA120T00020083001.1